MWGKVNISGTKPNVPTADMSAQPHGMDYYSKPDPTQYEDELRQMNPDSLVKLAAEALSTMTSEEADALISEYKTGGTPEIQDEAPGAPPGGIQ
jgi:hypothetical protein